jgi:HmuY protein
VTQDRKALLIGGGIAAAACVLVALSLRRAPPATFAVTPTAPVEVGAALAGPRVVTLDATDPDDWVFFDFSRGAVVDRPGGREWDLAFRRFHVLVNGGPAFSGDAAVADLGPVAFEAVTAAPVQGWVQAAAGRDSTNPAIARWYRYGFTSHLLTPEPRAWAIRTADGRYAKLRFLSYYCPGARPGCVTIEYVYQGGPGRDLIAPPAQAIGTQ